MHTKKPGGMLPQQVSRPPMKEHPLSAIEQQLTDDFRWAETATEVLQHEGKFVAVRLKRVIGFGTDRQAVAQAAAAQEGCRPEDLVVVIVPRANLQEIPH